MAEIGAKGGVKSAWTDEEDGYLLSKQGQTYLSRQPNANNNPQQCAYPLNRWTIKEAYNRASNLRARGKRQ